MSSEFSFEGFVDFVSKQDPEREINHLGNGWNDCAVGDYARSCISDMTSFDNLDAKTYRFGNTVLPDDVFRVLVNGRIATEKVPTYGKLNEFLQEFV